MKEDIKCAICVKIKKDNPHLSSKQLFPRGIVENAIAFVDGTGYCAGHLPENFYYKPPKQLTLKR